MFKRAASKIAHNTTIPVLAGNLAGNKDLRALQDLITAEKSVMNSLQRLSNDVAKASEALKAWGFGEGEDLGDTLSASAALYFHFASALSNFANHEAAVREHMKAVRSREETLDELRRRRKSLAAKADSADRTLSKMNSENKNLQTQTDLLNKLREDIRVMDTDIMAEEASLGDFKRLSAKTWMGLKFGGLLECSQKGVIIGESGKLVIEEIPMETTEPGLPRAYYTGHARTEYLVAEAQRGVNEVFFSPDPDPSQLSVRSPGNNDMPSMPTLSQGGQPYDYLSMGDNRRSSFSMPQVYDERANTPSAISQGSRLSQGPSGYSGLPQVQESGSLFPPYSPTDPAQHPTVSALRDVGEFGTYPPGQYAPRSSSLRSPDEKAGSPTSGRFSTFPVKAAGPRPPPGASSGSRPSSGMYTSPPIRGGDQPLSLDVNPPQDSFSTSIAEALGGQWPAESGPASSSTSAAGAGSKFGKADEAATNSMSYEAPPPMYTPPTSLPPGAAPAEPQYGGGYGGGHWNQGESLGVGRPGTDEGSHDGDHQLAYTALGHDDEPTASGHMHGDRRVHFGGVEDASNGPVANAPDGQQPGLNREATQSSEGDHTVTGHAPEPVPQQPVVRIPSPPRSSSPPQLPTHPEDPSQDEEALNAAAAREVSRELDALMFSSPTSTSAPRPPSPLAPPRPPFATRSVSPRPPMDINTMPPSVPAKIESSYVRERDRSLGSPISSGGEQSPSAPSAPSPTLSRMSQDQVNNLPPGSTLNFTVRSPSPATSVTSNPYRTPPEYPTPTTGAQSMYSLAPSKMGSGSGSSLSLTGGAPRTISAAAFRRQQQLRQQTGTAADISGSSGSDTTPLVVKKRPLPNSPYPSAGSPVGSGFPRVPSAPAPGTSLEAGARPNSTYRSVSAHQRDGASGDEDYDYISAYVDLPGHAEGGGQPAGYGQGQFATNLDSQDRVGLR
ncbi:hypothetical protein OBBRIDRAFT_814825 [Obba rivulosa]|uniref:Eisosome component PIL1-domain-containing protein n=1 Tax=Obba rivulosa TaxID=1052685 RepID=A0A8E2APJ0_9APHY|nr:hypothetical protein OBBRIDRAFT_814825 [Obba rivulosa]